MYELLSLLCILFHMFKWFSLLYLRNVFLFAQRYISHPLPQQFWRCGRKKNLLCIFFLSPLRWENSMYKAIWICACGYDWSDLQSHACKTTLTPQVILLSLIVILLQCCRVKMQKVRDRHASCSAANNRATCPRSKGPEKIVVTSYFWLQLGFICWVSLPSVCDPTAVVRPLLSLV